MKKFRPPTIEEIHEVSQELLMLLKYCRITFVTWYKDINLCGMHFQSVEYFKTVEKSQIPY